MPIIHPFASAKSDGGDATLIQPSNWNAEHAIAIPGSVFTGITADTGWDVMPAMLGRFRWSIASSGTVGAFGKLGVDLTQDGTLTSPGFATTSLATREQRHSLQSAAGPNVGCGIRQNMATYTYRSTTAGRGGFFFHSRIVIDTNLGGASGRLFVGLHSANAALTTDPSALTGDFVGIAYDAADTHLRLMSRDNVTTNNIDLGATAPKTDGLMYDVYLYCPPGGAAIYYRLDLSNGNTFTARLLEGNTATNLPRTDITMDQRVQGGTSSATQVTLGIAHMYCAWISG